MLKLSNLGAWIQERLNDTLAEYINNNADTRLKTDRMVYAFKVYTDQGKHKGFDYIDHNGNIVNQVTNHRVRYIECQLSQNDSTVEATGYVSVTRNTILEILIPLYPELLEERYKISEFPDYSTMNLKDIIQAFQDMLDRADQQELYKNADAMKAAFYKVLKREKVAAGVFEESAAVEGEPEEQVASNDAFNPDAVCSTVEILIIELSKLPSVSSTLP